MLNFARSFSVTLVAIVAVLICCGQVQAQKRQSRRRSIDTVKVGDKAPDFTLRKLNAKKGETVTLSSFQGKKPVVLFFGSYT